MYTLHDLRSTYRNVAALRADAAANANITVREYCCEVVVCHKHDYLDRIYEIEDDGSLTFLMYE